MRSDGRCSVGPDLGPKCLQRLSADNSSRQIIITDVNYCGSIDANVQMKTTICTRVLQKSS